MWWNNVKCTSKRNSIVVPKVAIFVKAEKLILNV